VLTVALLGPVYDRGAVMTLVRGLLTGLFTERRVRRITAGALGDP